MSVAPVEPSSEAPVEPDTCSKPPRHVKLGEIDGPNVMAAAVALNEVVQAKDKEITIDISSPGGDVELGLALIELMHQARDQYGVQITCIVAPGAYAASMAAVIFETGCSERVMHGDSVLMFHEPAVSGLGTAKESKLRRTADELADLNHRIAIMVAPKFRWTAARYEAWLAGRDRWLDLDEARQLHLVDRWLP